MDQLIQRVESEISKTPTGELRNLLCDINITLRENSKSDNKLTNEIRKALNIHSAENGSNTPDFILAEYLTNCLKAFDKTVNRRERWYGREKS